MMKKIVFSIWLIVATFSVAAICSSCGKKEERGELKESRKRIRELEAALANALMDRYLEQAFLEIACEKLQTTPEELKKKSGLTRSAVLGRKADKKP